MNGVGRMKVVKFGGSSLASGEQMKKVFQIVSGDKERKFVVVSAPGKRFKEDVKITDLLIACANAYLDGKPEEAPVEAILTRYAEIAEELGVDKQINDVIRKHIYGMLEMEQSNALRYMDGVMAAGEDNCAKLVAAYFQKEGLQAIYVNPKDAGLFVTDEPGNAQTLEESYENLYKLRDMEGIVVFPGFFGYSKSGYVVTYSRSGSDITGSVLAHGVKADLYENFTDVNGVYAANPSIVPNPAEVREITYREMRELSYAGFSVVHDEALIPAFQAGIPVNVKNTNNPDHPGTRIVRTREIKNGPVRGIASDSGFCSIYVSKYLMNREIGFGRKLLGVLEQYGISYEHTPSGIDDISVVFRQNQMTSETEEEIIESLKKELQPDDIVISKDLTLIMIVGEGMRHNVGTTARASEALAKAHINIEMINQGSSEVSIMFCINSKDEKKAVRVLYEEFYQKDEKE